jgi:hypothetical protein
LAFQSDEDLPIDISSDARIDDGGVSHDYITRMRSRSCPNGDQSVPKSASRWCDCGLRFFSAISCRTLNCSCCCLLCILMTFSCRWDWFIGLGFVFCLVLGTGTVDDSRDDLIFLVGLFSHVRNKWICTHAYHIVAILC